MTIFRRAGALLLALIMTPSIALAQISTDTPARAPAGFLPAQAQYCSNDSGESWIPCPVASGGGGGGGSGDASAANQTTQIARLASILAAIGDVTTPVSGSTNYLLKNGIVVNTHAVTQSGTWNVGVAGSVAVTGTFWQATQPISVATLPLPSGAATSSGVTTVNTTLTTTNSTLTTINTTLGSLSVIAQPALTTARWQYAAASGGIVNTTTAITIKAAAGAGVRNYTMGCQFQWQELSAETDIVLRDGAAGTVMWRYHVPVSGSAGTESISFAAPLQGAANTLLEVATTTAVTGGVWVSCQGITGA